MPDYNFWSPFKDFQQSIPRRTAPVMRAPTSNQRFRDTMSYYMEQLLNQPAVRTGLTSLTKPFEAFDAAAQWAEPYAQKAMGAAHDFLRLPNLDDRYLYNARFADNERRGLSGFEQDENEIMGQGIMPPGKAVAGKAAKLAAKVKAERAAAEQAKAIQEVVAQSRKRYVLDPVTKSLVEKPATDPIAESLINNFRARREAAQALPELPGASRTLGAGSIQPKPAQLRQQSANAFTTAPRRDRSNPLMATVPNRLLVSEGSSVPFVGEGESLALRPGTVTDFRRRGYMPDPNAPKQLPASPVSDYLPESSYLPELRRSIEEQVFPTPPRSRLLPETGTGRLPDLPEFPSAFRGGRRPPTDLPPIDLESLYKPPPGLPDITSPLGGARPPIIPNAFGNAGATLQDYGYRAITDRMRGDSRAGQLMADLLTTTRLDEEALAGSLKEASRANRAAIEKLYRKGDKKLWDEFVEALDTGAPVTHPELRPIVEAERARLSELGRRAEASGMGFKTAEGKLLKFQSREPYYFPHQYGDDFFKNQEAQIAALVKRYGITPDEANKIIIRAREHGGRLIPENETVRAQMAKRGERYISEQHTRELDLPGFLRTPEALDRHYTNMAKRIVEAEKLGPMDIADPKSPIGALLKQTTDEPAMRAYLERVLGRELKPNVPKSRWAKFSSGVLKGEAAAHLSLFPISNAQQVAAIPLKTSLGSFLKAGKNKILDRAGVRQRAFRGGAMEAADTDALQEYGNKSAINTIFGMGRSEKTVRSFANEAGQIEVQRLFDKLRRGDVSDRVKNKLEDLTRTPINQLKAQEALTQEQINRAGARLSETTMGRAQAMDLPYGWSSGPGSNMLLLFKKYGYRQAHTMINAIKENPMRNIPTALLGFQVAGETAGDLKSGIKGFASGLIKEGKPIKGAWDAIKERGQWMKLNSKNPAVNRIIDNYMQAWLLGLPGDAIAALAKNDQSVWQFIGGPVVSDVVDVGRGVAELMTSGNSERLTNKAARSIPYIGSGVAAGVKPKPKVTGSGGRRGSAGRR